MSESTTLVDAGATESCPGVGSFVEKLRARWQGGQTLLCVGLDPEIERMPASLRPDERDEAAVEEAIFSFTSAIVDATADLVCAYKPNAAFYETHGPAGLRALIRLVAHIHQRHSEVPALVDAKRGDMGNTSRAYARAIFDVIGADAVTLHPYLGLEGCEPFLAYGDRGSFFVCRTSNPDSAEFQSLRVRSAEGGDEEPLYLAVARRVATEWNTRGNCGLVVGATYPGELRHVREVAGDVPILVPGIGAQGGDLEASVRAGLDSSGAGLLISASRSVLYASSGDDYAEAARAEALRLRDAIEVTRREGRD